MSQGHIIKSSKNLRADIIQTAHINGLATCGNSAGNKLMRNKHIALVLCQLQLRYSILHRIMVAANLCCGLLRCPMLHNSRLQKRQQENIHIAEFILQHKLLLLTVVAARKMNAAAAHQLRAERQALCRIMVAADDAHRHLKLRQLIQKIIKQNDSFCRRYRFIVNISGKQYTIRLLGANHLYNTL